MRRIALTVIASLAIAACSNDTTSPAADDALINSFLIGSSTALTSAGGYDGDLYQQRLINGLPDELKLTPEQQAKIKALVDAFQASTKADHDALNAILREARDAIAAHKSRDEVKAILDKGIAIRNRLSAAEAALRAAIEAVLTPEQKAWLDGHRAARCDPSKFPPLTDAQKAQMRALEQAFQTANKADLDAVKAIIEQARAAAAAGKSKAEVEAIMATAHPAMARLDAARQALKAALEAVLTPEQKAWGCFPVG
jgi:Spy/CpxP family protein refolding chaperone